MGESQYRRPDVRRLTTLGKETIISPIYNRIALDVAATSISHAKLDDDGRYLEDINSGLNSCLNLEANIDQTSRAFLQDYVLSMFDEGFVAIVPVDTDRNPLNWDSYDIFSMRVAKIVAWYPKHVKVNVYNEATGRKTDILLPKQSTSIIENPFYLVMNEKSSIVQRLIRKLSLLDAIDEQSGSGKLDLIIQLPYVIKTQSRKDQAEERRKDIEKQLSGSKYGIAYTDGTERITQLNRPVENNLMKQIEYLTSMLYSQLGINQAIMDGTADEKTMQNYYTRTIEPIVASLVDEMKRKFISKEGRANKESIVYFRNPFKLIPVTSIAEMGDSLTRNEIVTGNEMRQSLGLKPSKDPSADELRNKNLNISKDQQNEKLETLEKEDQNQNA